MKRDGRTLDHATLEEFRLLALRRVREGEKPSEVVKSLGMNRTSIYRWLKAASGRGNGERALAPRPAGVVAVARDRQSGSHFVAVALGAVLMPGTSVNMSVPWWASVIVS